MSTNGQVSPKRGLRRKMNETTKKKVVSTKNVSLRWSTQAPRDYIYIYLQIHWPPKQTQTQHLYDIHLLPDTNKKTECFFLFLSGATRFGLCRMSKLNSCRMWCRAGRLDIADMSQLFSHLGNALQDKTARAKRLYTQIITNYQV